MTVTTKSYEANIKDLKPTSKNPRQISKEDFEVLKKSLRDFPEMKSIREVVIDENMRILGGHQRVKALKSIGEKTVPVRQVFGLTEEQKDEFMIKDNIANGEWDMDILANEWDPEVLADWGLDAIDWEKPEKEIIEDDPPEPPEEAKSKLGEIYQLGNHRVMCGDSTKKEEVARLMDGEKADLVVTDPPYNVDYEGGTGLRILNDSMEDSSFRKFLEDSFSAVDNVMKPGAAFYIWHADSEGYNFRTACKNAGWQVRECLIWNKDSLVLGRQDYQWKHEPCLYGWKEGASHNWYGDRKQTTVLDFERPKKSDEHPTMKPVKLIAYQVQNSSKEGDLILDSFGGSGTTLIACEQLDRKCYMMELDPHYVDVIIERWENLTGEKAQKIS